MTDELLEKTQALIVQSRPRILTYMVGPRRAMRRLTTPVMLRAIIGLTQIAILGLLALLVASLMVKLLVPISVALLTIALNLLATMASLVAIVVMAGLLMRWWRIHR